MVQRIEMQYRIYDDELDLSFEDLEEVPMECIKSFPEVVIVDLSHNCIQCLPKEFPICLENLKQLDLSYNCLSGLPETFGSLTNLRCLDLSCNNIRHLDVSFGKLINLESLNLKGNNLLPILKEVTAKQWGVDENYSCAKNIVMFMQQVDAIENQIGYVYTAPEQSIPGEDTKVEVLFSRRKSDRINGEGLLVEDRQGKFYYVTFQKVVKTPSLRITENVSNNGNSSNANMSVPERVSSRKLSGANNVVQKVLLNILLGILLTCFCTILLSLTVYPEHLKSGLDNVMDTKWSIVLTFFKWHSWIFAKMQAISIFPISPPLKPKALGFWEWLGHSMSSIFYTLFLNYSPKK